MPSYSKVTRTSSACPVSRVERGRTGTGWLCGVLVCGRSVGIDRSSATTDTTPAGHVSDCDRRHRTIFYVTSHDHQRRLFADPSARSQVRQLSRDHHPSTDRAQLAPTKTGKINWSSFRYTFYTVFTRGLTFFFRKFYNVRAL